MEIIYQHCETLIKQQPLSFSLLLLFLKTKVALRFWPLAAAFFSVALFVRALAAAAIMCRVS
jgi:hypothetical protein